jgi:hypothetical protein
MKTLDSLTVALAEGTRVTVRNGKLFVITNAELPSVNDTICTAFLDKKQFVSALLKHSGASKFVNDKLIEELDVKVGDNYVTKRVYNDYAVAYAASHCSYVLQPTLMEAGDTYDKANGELGVIETSYIKFDIVSVEPDEAMSAALTKYAAAERDFFGF